LEAYFAVNCREEIGLFLQSQGYDGKLPVKKRQFSEVGIDRKSAIF
jgi:hypothetical protein